MLNYSRTYPQDDCTSFYGRDDIGIRLSDSNLCASSDVGDTCAGDSGGGLVTFNREGSFEVIGIISFGIGCNSTIDGNKILIIAIEVIKIFQVRSYQEFTPGYLNLLIGSRRLLVMENVELWCYI